MRMFWERGFEGTSLDDLMDVMGLNPSSFYSAFGSKQKLCIEAMDQYFVGPGGYCDGFSRRRADGDRRRLRPCGGSVHERGISRRVHDLGRQHLRWARTSRLRDELRHRRNDLESAFVGYMTDARSKGELPADTDIESLATFFAACMRGMIVLSCDGASRDKLKAIGRMTMRAWPDT
jgi:AcrR family transcriptional regulator